MLLRKKEQGRMLKRIRLSGKLNLPLVHSSKNHNLSGKYTDLEEISYSSFIVYLPLCNYLHR